MATLDILPFDAAQAGSGYIQIYKRGVQSADLKAGGVQLDSDDSVVIHAEGNDNLNIYLLDTGGGAVVTFAAGDDPPSSQGAKGAKTYTVPDADEVVVTPEAGRHIKADGTIVLTSTEQVLVWVTRNDYGFEGVSVSNRETIPAAG